LVVTRAAGAGAQQGADAARSVPAAPQATAPAGATASRLIASGAAGQGTLKAPRVSGADAGAAVNGVLGGPGWQGATLLTEFPQFLPNDGLPAEDSTQVLVWYSPTAIYFGVRAFEPHGAVRATLAVRDKIGGDDGVHFLIDTFNDRRRALDFGVNP